jgi:YD repeat-containing protein
MINGLRNAVHVIVSFATLVVGEAAGQYCRVATTYFASNFSRPGCSGRHLLGCLAVPGSTAITGSPYPSTNYACATTAPAAGALENTLYAYDGNGNRTSTKDPLAHSTVNTYDALNRLTQVLDPANKTTGYAYNGNGTLLQVSDPRFLNTVYSPKRFWRNSAAQFPDTRITTYLYDSPGDLGRLKAKTDARGSPQVTRTTPSAE